MLAAPNPVSFMSGEDFPNSYDPNSGTYTWNDSSFGNQTMNGLDASQGSAPSLGGGGAFSPYVDPGAGAGDQTAVNNNYAGNYNKSAYDVNSTLFPFLTGEVTKPAGFGDDTVNKMKTESGEAIAGGLGQATEAAQLLGSRTGNTAASPGIIDAASRNAMKQTSTNDLNIDVDNAKAKMAQQQAGASGLNSQYGTDVNAALGSLGLVNQANQIGNQNDQNGFFGSFLRSLGTTLGSPTVNIGNQSNPPIIFG